MSIYIYHGSMSADTINKIDYIFVDGAEYTLPETNNKVKRMVRQGALTLKQELAAQKDEVPTTSRKGTREQRALCRTKQSSEANEADLRTDRA